MLRMDMNVIYLIKVGFDCLSHLDTNGLSHLDTNVKD